MNPWPAIEWTDDFGHRYSLSCFPVMTGEVLFDLRCLDDTEKFHSNLPRRAAADIARRLKEVLDAMAHV